MRLLVGIFLWLGGGAAALAATYYVDYGSGSDSNSGTSPNEAWNHCPGDPQAKGQPAAVRLQPGDTVRFKGGTIYVGQLLLAYSGATNNPITYDGNQPESWGTGRAILDGGYVPRAIIEGAAGVSHLVIRGFEIRNAGGYADNDPILQKKCEDFKRDKGRTGVVSRGGYGVRFERGGHQNLLIDNLYIHRCGQWRNTAPFANVTGFGIAIQDANGVVIRNCDITKTRAGISLKATKIIENIEVANCVLHDYIVWCIDVSPRRAGAFLRNITIRDSVFRDYHQHDSGNWTGCGEKPHTDGVFLRTARMASVWENVRIFGCEFYADYYGQSKRGTASVYISQGPSASIYNCTFRGDRHTRAIDVAGRNPATAPKQVVRIYNNSFLFSAQPVFLATETNRARREVYIQNNIMVRSGGRNVVMVNRDSGVDPVVMDNNIYWDPQFGAGQKYVYRAKAYRTFGATKGLGYEAHGIYADPKYANIKGDRPSLWDLRLSPGSPAIGRGANLSAWFTQDKLGKPRPAAGPWTCGAFEYP